MRGVRLMSDNFVFLAGTYLSFKIRGLQIYWRFGEFQWVAEAQIQANSRFSKFSPFGANIDLQPSALCNSRRPPLCPRLSAAIHVVPHH